jgi:hypothetical protein
VGFAKIGRFSLVLACKIVVLRWWKRGEFVVVLWWLKTCQLFEINLWKITGGMVEVP